MNAHLIVEEWTGIPPKQATRKPTGKAPKLVTAQQPREVVAPLPVQAAEPVAVVGVAAHVGPWADTRELQEHVLSGDVVPPKPKTNGWSLASEPSPAGFYIDELKLPIDRFRIPPKELEETLPQQLLMLQVAAAALDDAACSEASGGHKPPESTSGADHPTTGTFIGLGLDLNTTNFHLRWSALAADADPDNASPPLSANRTMGALGSIAASRIARAFHFGGPSHTVCSEEGSAARAIELGVRALQSRDLDRALVGGVDLAGDPRVVLPGGVRFPGEGGVAFVLKRLADAERDGDRIYAIIRGVGVAANAESASKRAVHDAGISEVPAVGFDATADVGNTGFASGGVSFLKACLALYQEVLPGDAPQYWLHNRREGPRRASVNASGADGSHFAFILEEHTGHTSGRTPKREQPLAVPAR